MKKALKYIGIALVVIIGLGMIIDANKSPEQKAAEAVAHEKEQAKQAEDNAKKAENKREQAVQDGTPKCDSSVAKETLKNAFDQSQFARTMNLSAVEIAAIRENTFDSKNGSRTCYGTIAMNNTNKVDVNFKIEPRTDDKIMLTFEVTKGAETPE